MRHGTVIAYIVVLLTACGGASAQGIKGREIFGVRFGGIGSTMELNDAFGSGSELEIFFVEGLTSWFGIGAALSGHNFGKSKDPDKDLEFLGIPQPVEVSILSMALTLYGQRSFSSRVTGAAEGGGGLYTTSAKIPAGAFAEGRITKNQLGLFCGASLSYRITDGGIALNLGGKFHYVFSGSDPRQALYIYTGREAVHFFQITLGVTIFTGSR